MQEVVGKLKDLVLLLEKKIDENDKTAKRLADELALAKNAHIRNTAMEDGLHVREKNVAAIEDVVRMAEDAKKKHAEASKIKADNVLAMAALEKTKKLLDEKEASFKSMVDLYRQKNASLEAEKVQLEKDRKEMRAKIIEELKKLK